MEIVQQADYRVFNLEIPLTDQQTPIEKCGPNLIAPTSVIHGYKAIGVDFLTLANNHILDQGEQGLWSTTEQLNRAGIAYAGVGHTPDEAAAPHIIELGQKKASIYCCAEHEFSIITEHTAGANPFDPLESLDHVAELKKQCDYVIVLYHGGKEHYRYPSPNLQKTCRKLVEKGANLVICQHTHCIGCEEKYQGGTIIYGQGNFLFDDSNSEYWQTSLLIQINDDFTVSYIPLIKRNETVRLATAEQAREIMDGFHSRSEEIQIPGKIEEKYGAFSKQMLDSYLMRISSTGKSFIFKAVNKLTGHRFASWYLHRRYKKQDLLAIANCLDCEAHRELFLKGLGEPRQ